MMYSKGQGGIELRKGSHVRGVRIDYEKRSNKIKLRKKECRGMSMDVEEEEVCEVRALKK